SDDEGTAVVQVLGAPVHYADPLHSPLDRCERTRSEQLHSYLASAVWIILATSGLGRLSSLPPFPEATSSGEAPLSSLMSTFAPWPIRSWAPLGQPHCPAPNNALSPPRTGSELPRPIFAVRLLTSVIRAFTSAPFANSISSVAIERSCTSAASGLKRG